MKMELDRKTATHVLLQSFSILVSGFVLVSIFTMHTGLAPRDQVLLTIVTLATAVTFRYAVVYHRFTKPIYRWALVVPLSIATVVMGAITLNGFLRAISLADLSRVFHDEELVLRTNDFLPEWWIVGILVPAGVLVFLGTIVNREPRPYPKPTRIRQITISPAYFGVVCTFLGLWAVLFVGFRVQRIIVIAPIFEELLKFGVAILVGSVLFDRSLLARTGVAVVVGSLFGIIEHSSTYSAEPDTVYLFRTLFHASSTVLSVGVYTLFESQGEEELQWISTAYGTLIHFFYNTFSVLSAIIALTIFDSQTRIATLTYGGAAILLAITLFFLTAVRHGVIRTIHRPLAYVLSDLV